MKKYLVDVYVPAARKHYDAFIPSGKTIWEVTKLLIEICESLSPGEYKGSSSSILINADNGNIFNSTSTVYDSGIRNSARLILT